MSGKNLSAVVNSPNAPFEFKETAIPTPGEDEVVIEVKACGLCHSDSMAVSGHFPGVPSPIIPGHEVAGVIVAVGSSDKAAAWEEGDHVGVGWFGKCCHLQSCEACNDGDCIVCPKLQATGIHFNGGYQRYMTARVDSVAKMPDGLDFIQAAPLCCAGVTTFNALRHNPAPAGSLVAVQGIGGLGHLAIQFARKMGYQVAAISRGTAKKQQALDLGAHHYIDSTAGSVSKALQELGGARVILATGFNSEAMTALIDGLGRNGVLVTLGVDVEPIKVTPLQLVPARKSIKGHPSGTARDCQDCLAFAHMNGVKVTTQVYPFAKVQDAYQAMVDGQFRVVLDMTQ